MSTKVKKIICKENSADNNKTEFTCHLRDLVLECDRLGDIEWIELSINGNGIWKKHFLFSDNGTKIPIATGYTHGCFTPYSFGILKIAVHKDITVLVTGTYDTCLANKQMIKDIACPQHLEYLIEDDLAEISLVTGFEKMGRYGQIRLAFTDADGCTVTDYRVHVTANGAHVTTTRDGYYTILNEIMGPRVDLVVTVGNALEQGIMMCVVEFDKPNQLLYADGCIVLKY